MTKQREGYRNIFTQLPRVVADALIAEAEDNGHSIAKMLAIILAKRYRITPDQIPPPRRTGRRPKKVK